jgi:hypothetical protein
MNMKKVLLIAVALGAALITAACNNAGIGPDPIVGEYSRKPDGETNVRITKENGSYTIELLRSGPVEKVRLVEAPEGDLDKIVGAQNWKLYGEKAFVGADNQPVFFAKVKTGPEVVKALKVSSGYMAIFGIFPAQLYKK